MNICNVFSKIVITLAMLVAAGTYTMASAAVPKAYWPDSQTYPVYFVHGISVPISFEQLGSQGANAGGANCASTWDTMIKRFQDLGYKGKMKKVKYSGS